MILKLKQQNKYIRHFEVYSIEQSEKNKPWESPLWDSFSHAKAWYRNDV